MPVGRAARPASRRAEHAREDRVVPERAHEQVAVVARRRPSSRCRSRRSGRCELRRAPGRAGDSPRAVAAQPPGQPVVGERDGGDALGVRRLGVAQPAQLRRGERGDRARRPVRSGVRRRRRPRRSGRGAACAERVSFQSRAARMTRPSASSTTMPCCWPADRDRARRPSSPPASANAAGRAPHQCGGIAPRCRRGARRGRSARAPRSRRPGPRPCTTASTSRRRRRVSWAPCTQSLRCWTRVDASPRR